MKLLTVVGARPQFIKAAAFSRTVRERHTEILVHTGQHYDPSMSDVFFEELGLPRPDHHLGVGSGPHGRQTAQMLERLEDVIRAESPDAVVIYGDTNSTLAGALAAAKLDLPLAHVEAGLRSHVRAMPEEVNRIVADSVSTHLFAPTQTAVDNLLREGHALERGGARGRIYFTGDIMYDALLQQAPVAMERSHILERLALKPGAYAVATVHRAANTDDTRRLESVIDALMTLGEPVILPLHPRTGAALAHTDIEVEAPVRIIDPIGYLDMLALQQHARIVLTDSGGLQKEAFLLGVPCVTLRDETEWVETLDGGWNVLAGADSERILAAARRPRPPGAPPHVFGDGHAAERMVQALEAR
ncbi:MAG TPA: UDP-N-acetylglucosamine 2-epimerase (non-hydrolyzing) [Dehalococcoidia bacterium]|nr:UDP-N-acetylglucosamine 2-epimerase (non-hydrolyzing) [Dehalococcoidia bacterium]